MAMELLTLTARIDLIHVPYTGGQKSAENSAKMGLTGVSYRAVSGSVCRASIHWPSPFDGRAGRQRAGKTLWRGSKQAGDVPSLPLVGPAYELEPTGV